MDNPNVDLAAWMALFEVEHWMNLRATIRNLPAGLRESLLCRVGNTTLPLHLVVQSFADRVIQAPAPASPPDGRRSIVFLPPPVEVVVPPADRVEQQVVGPLLPERQGRAVVPSARNRRDRSRTRRRSPVRHQESGEQPSTSRRSPTDQRSPNRSRSPLAAPRRR